MAGASLLQEKTKGIEQVHHEEGSERTSLWPLIPKEVIRKMESLFTRACSDRIRENTFLS